MSANSAIDSLRRIFVGKTLQISAPVRPFSLSVYLLMVVALSWPFQLVNVLWDTNLPMGYALNATSMLMVGVATWIAGRYVFGDGFAGAGWRWGRLRHHLAVLSLVMLLWVLPALVGLLVGDRIMPDSIIPEQVVEVFVLLFVTLIPGFGEEFGWRGYLLPRLMHRMTPRKAVLLHALIWWAWHLPLIIGGAVQASLATVAQAGELTGLLIAASVAFLVIASAIPAILHGVVFAYIWSRSRSLAVVTVYHAAYDGVRDSLGSTLGLGPVAQFWSLGVLLSLGVACLWKANWPQLNDAVEMQSSQGTLDNR